MVPLNVSEVLDSVYIAPPKDTMLSVKLLVPVKLSTVLYTAGIAPPPWSAEVKYSILYAKIAPPNDDAEALFCEVVACKGNIAKAGLHRQQVEKYVHVFCHKRQKSKSQCISILNSTTLVKLKPTDPSQTTVALLPKEDSPHMVNPSTLATVIFISRTWSPGKNTIVVSEVKYSSVCCAYSEVWHSGCCEGRRSMKWQWV